LYLPGILPVLSFASLTVRPPFLQLVETHIVSLGPSPLRPALKAMILSLLPGLEEETSEDFDRIFQLLNRLRSAVRLEELQSQSPFAETAGSQSTAQDSYFWQCLFLATVTNPSRRLGALAYLSRELPKFGTHSAGASISTPKSISPAARAALTPEPGLLIRCLAAGLSDEQLLVQRGFLDLLVQHLPLNSLVLQDLAPQKDLDRLVFAAIGVVARRDMSLNRRLWAWLLGPDPKAHEEDEGRPNQEIVSPGSAENVQAAYFAQYGLQPLIRSTMALFAATSKSPTEQARPFRLCLSLMDRLEVGGFLIPHVFIPAMRNVYDYCKVAEKPGGNEVLKSASNFFDGVESGLIWAKFNQLGAEAIEPSPKSRQLRVQDLDLCSFIIRHFNISEEEEMLLQHIPHSSLYFLVLLRLSKEKVNSESLNDQALSIVESLVLLIPETTFSGAQKASDITKRRTSGSHLDTADIFKRVNAYYVDQNGGLDGSRPPFPSVLLGSLLLRESIKLFLDYLSSAPASTAIEPLSRTICSLLFKVQNAAQILQETDLFGDIFSRLQDESSAKVPFRMLSACTSLFVAAYTLPDQKHYFESSAQTELLQHKLLELAWQHLDPWQPKHHVEAARCFWQIDLVEAGSRFAEAAIATFMVQDWSQKPAESTQVADPLRKFAVLWNHSTQEKGPGTEKVVRGLPRRTSSFMTTPGHSPPSDAAKILRRPLLLALDTLEPDNSEASAFTKSWLQDLPTLSRVFGIICDSIRALHCWNIKKSSTAKQYDGRQLLYYLDHLQKILRHASDHTWTTIAGEVVNPLEGGEDITLQVLLVQIALRSYDVADSWPRRRRDIGQLRQISLSLMQSLFHSPVSSPLEKLDVGERLLSRLATEEDSLLQSSLLETITAVSQLHSSSRRQSSIDLARRNSKEIGSLARLSMSRDNATDDSGSEKNARPPAQLIEILRNGFSSRSTPESIDSWVRFLVIGVPMFAESVSQNLVPLVECLCMRIATVFDELKSVFSKVGDSEKPIFTDAAIISLLNGLEHVLATSHERLLSEEGKSNPKSPDQPQGFFGNMVQGVFAGDNQQVRATVGNNRLTVLLCFQDTVRICFRIWAWWAYHDGKPDSSSSATFTYTSIRLRNRARRLLEHLFAAEALECLETLAGIWCRSPSPDIPPNAVLNLLNVLNGSRPKHTIPAIFNAIYSRSNPGALDQSRMSSLTTDLQDRELVIFLVEYTRTVDDDAMDEIWNDCVAFLKDILANPLPHSHILSTLLEFTALVAEKMDNTNFGDQRRMRKELGVSW
jgi:hypothetical protein